jgi:predicted PurR-regulated permease PerM
MKPLVQNRFVQNLCYSLLAIVLVVTFLKVLQDILVPLIFAALFAFMLLPVVKYLESKRIPSVSAILISIFLAIGFLVLVFYLIANQITQLDNLLPLLNEKLDLWFEQAQIFLKSNYNLDQTKILKEAQKSMSEILKNGSLLVSSVLGFTGNFLINLTLLPLYIFLFLLYRNFLESFLFKLFKSTPRKKVEHNVEKIVVLMAGYITGLLKVILVVGILNTLALYFLGIEQALFFGFLASFLVLIPYIGIAIGAILPILVALLTKDSYWYAVGVAISFYIIQFLEGNFITPYIVGNQISINPLVAIVSLLLFGMLWGLPGLVLALPLTAILKVIFDASERTRAWGFLLGDVKGD